MSGAAEKVFNDRKVNQGLPKGMTLKQLQIGRWVKVRWEDAPDEWGIVTDVDDRRASYKGDRGFRFMSFSDKAGPYINSHAVHTQIVDFGALVSRNVLVTSPK